MKFRSVVVVAILLLSFVGVQLDGKTSAGALPSSVTITGHGFGHGRGMGQYGALGYAINSGWSWQQIIGQYYGGTTISGGNTPNVTVGVRMNELDGIDTIVTSGSGFTMGSVSIGAGAAGRVHKTGSNTFEIDTAPNCSGPWSAAATGVTGPVTTTSSNPGPALSQVLQLCMPTVTMGVFGNVQSFDDSGTQRTVNNLAEEDYLRGVVPREMPASWGDLGSGAGLNALEAQAVAARSYLLSQGDYSYATICDSTTCQVYGGAYQNGSSVLDARSDAAVANTAGVVARFGNGGAIAHAEYSASTGGYTAGGTFPAVPDAGDSVAQNPYHAWNVTFAASVIQSAYPSIGAFQAISVTGRNGLGDFGGRVTTVNVVGTSGTVSTTGNGLAAALNLKSNWFQIQGQASGGVGGYWQVANDGGIFTFGDAPFYGSMGGKPLNAPIVSLTSAPHAVGYWEVASDGGIFTYGQALYYGSMGGKPLNKPIVGMATTPDGQGYWEVASDGGIFTYGDARYFGSMGGKPLNRPIVGMATTPDGQGYWLVASDGGIFAYGDANFYGSTGSMSLRQPIVGMASVPNGNGYWLVAADGGVFAYNATFAGSLPGENISAHIVGLAPTTTGQGYAMASTNGNIYQFGDAPFFGNLSSVSPTTNTVLAIIATP